LGNVLRVVAVDLPGHGESDPMPHVSVEEYGGVVAKFIDALGLGSVIAVGHSLGGAIAIALASQRSGRVRGLVLLSSCVKLPEGDDWTERFLAYLPGPLRKLLFFAMARKLLFAPGASGNAIAVGMRELRACRPETILKDVHAARAMDLTGPATRLAVPTLILVGSQDRLTTPALAQHLSELIRGALLRIHEDAGHMLLLEVPAWVNAEVLGFVGSITALAQAPSSRAGEGQHSGSLVRRLLDCIRRVARRPAS